MTERAWRVGLLAFLAAGSLAGCGGPPPGSGGAGLQGTWLVQTTSGDATFFGSAGPVTLAFAGADVGTVALRVRYEESAAIACGTLVFAVDGDQLFLSSPRFFDATFDLALVDEDTATIANDDVAATLTRFAGAGPVPDCGEAPTSVATTLPFVASSFGTLTAFDGTLFVNVDDDPGTVVGYDVATDTVGAGRALTASIGGTGIHRWMVGARDGARFYGHCGCGGSTTLSAVDLDADSVLASVDVEVAATVPFSVDYGAYAGTTLLVGGQTRDGNSANRLAEADPDTLALANERNVLEGLNLVDVAVIGDDLYGLVYLFGGPALVAIDADGRATASYPLPELHPLQPIGVAAIDGVAYVAASDNLTGTTVLLAVELP